MKRELFRIAGGRFLDLDSLYLSTRSERANWTHGDVLLAEWYRNVGVHIDFDILYFVEWDLLLLDPLEHLYSHVPTGAVALTAPRELSSVAESWFWLERGDNRRQWEELIHHARSRWGYSDIPHACLGPGPMFPRTFLEKISGISIPLLSNDEIRYPLFAQLFGFEITDTRFRLSWSGTEEDRYFNFNSVEIDRQTIAAELALPHGRRAFHPVRTVVRDRDDLY